MGWYVEGVAWVLVVLEEIVAGVAAGETERGLRTVACPIELV